MVRYTDIQLILIIYTYLRCYQHRESKCAGKGVDLSPHSRQHTNGIRIPTTFAAVLGEWGNVKAQICSWAWKGGSVLASKHFQGTKRLNVLDNTLRCVRCDTFKSKASGVAEVSTLWQLFCD